MIAAERPGSPRVDGREAGSGPGELTVVIADPESPGVGSG